MIAGNLQELELSLKKLSAASKQWGVEIKMSKINVHCNKQADQRQIFLEGSVPEEVQSYIYLGQRIRLAETKTESRINRRIQARWKSFY